MAAEMMLTKSASLLAYLCDLWKWLFDTKFSTKHFLQYQCATHPQDSPEHDI